MSTRCPTFVMDTTGGCGIVTAAIMALHHRKKTGRGMHIDLAQSQTILPGLGEAMMDYSMNGRVQESMENRHPVAIQGCYRCIGDDDWVVITINDEEEWNGFCRAIGNPAWTKEEKFADLLNRHKNQDELDERIEVWTSQHDKFQVMEIMQKEGVPAGPVISEKDAYENPHLRERGFFLEINQKWCGTHEYPGFPWKFTRTPQEAYLPPPGLGEHNEYVYKELLGISDEEYAQLEKEEYLGTEYLPSVP